ncbi:MAG TPA: transketolase family protein [Terracidiphilus sp.]|nr:transketolase family protein [Terracidiphilus sp.]
MVDCRDAYSKALEEMASADERIVAVVNDSLSSTKLKGFKDKFPRRLVNVGIAEQNMVGVGAGLANAGKIPYVCGAACFLTARSMEQVKIDLGYSNANVRLVGISSGMAYGELGPTHHSIEDMGWMRIIPNMTIIVPADAIETDAVMQYSVMHEGPMFLRISRIPVPDLLPAGARFQLGKAVCLREGNDVTLMANGVLVCRALQAAEELATEGISARVLNMSSVKPIDREAIVDAARTTGGIVTAEEHSIYGGLGGAVAEIVAQTHPAKMRILGVPGVFAPTGSAEFLLEHFGLTAEGIRTAALELLHSR